MQVRDFQRLYSAFPHAPRALGASLLGVLTLIACGEAKNGAGEAAPQGSARGFKSAPAAAGNPGLYAPIIEPTSPLAMGFAVDLNNHSGIPNRCVDGTIETVPQQEGYLSLDADSSRDEIESNLGVKADAKVKFLKWGGSARGHFAQAMRSNSYGLNYVVFAYNKHHSKVFIPTGRNAAWKNASPEEWNESCGGGYVAAQDYGSMLIVKFSLQLENKAETRDWGGRAGGSYLSMAKLRASLSGNSKTKRSKGTLSLSAIQVGGKPAELGKLLKTGDDKGVIESFALCDVSDAEKCLAGLRSIENYIANEFPKQMDDKESGGPAVLTTYPFKYAKTVGSDFNPGLDTFVQKARGDLTDLYEAEMRDVETLKAFAKKDDADAQETLTKATANVSAIRQATELCYRTATYQECATRAEELALACAETVVPSGLGTGDSGQGNTPSNSGE